MSWPQILFVTLLFNIDVNINQTLDLHKVRRPGRGVLTEPVLQPRPGEGVALLVGQAAVPHRGAPAPQTTTLRFLFSLVWFGLLDIGAHLEVAGAVLLGFRHHACCEGGGGGIVAFQSNLQYLRRTRV